MGRPLGGKIVIYCHQTALHKKRMSSANGVPGALEPDLLRKKSHHFDYQSGPPIASNLDCPKASCQQDTSRLFISAGEIKHGGGYGGKVTG